MELVNYGLISAQSMVDNRNEVLILIKDQHFHRHQILAHLVQRFKRYLSLKEKIQNFYDSDWVTFVFVEPKLFINVADLKLLHYASKIYILVFAKNSEEIVCLAGKRLYEIADEYKPFL